MCGMAVVLDDGGGDEDFDVGGDGIRMLPPPPAQCDGGVWGPRRGCCGCVLWTLLLLLWNIMLVLVCVGLMVLVFTLLLYAGLLCHSRVLASLSSLCRYLDDNSCSALIILAFVMMSPLVVVAAATFCALLRRLHLLLHFQPITGAWYRGHGLEARRPCLGLMDILRSAPRMSSTNSHNLCRPVYTQRSTGEKCLRTATALL